MRCFLNAARDERAGLRSVAGVVERGTGPTGSLWSEANRALVTAVASIELPDFRPDCHWPARSWP
jgi:hypothetical protein